MSIAQLFAFLVKLSSNEDLREAIAHFVAFLNSLSEKQRVSYLSKFTSLKGYGCPCDPDCPDCPDNCKVVEDAILETVTA